MRMSRLLGLVTVGLSAHLIAAAHAESRVALIIGNGAYQNVAHLTNPANDARLVGDALQQDGFAVTIVEDADRDHLANALRTFGRQADSSDWAVIYYAGHGIEVGGTNYLIPIDARLETDRDVGLEAVPLDQVMSAIEGARHLRLVILDACRNNPFAATIKRTAGGGRDIGRGLARIEPAQATLVAYSAKDGSVALDGEGADSPYAIALAKHLTEPGVEVDKLFRLVRDDVEEATGTHQEPFVYGSLPGHEDFYFRPPSAVAVAPGAAAPAAGLAASDYQAAAAVGTIAAWDLFLGKHQGASDDFYVGLAREARRKLAAKPTAAAPAELTGRNVLLALEGRWAETDCVSNSTEFHFAPGTQSWTFSNSTYHDIPVNVGLDKDGNIKLYFPSLKYSETVTFLNNDVRQTADTDENGKVSKYTYHRCQAPS